ncbi:MAG: DUF488 family protein [Acidimicrobiia bacterium]
MLSEHAVTTVVDVRSEPEPNAGETSLAEECRIVGLGYVWMGDRLGSRPRHPSLLGTDGEPNWPAVVAAPAFRAGIGELKTLATQGRVVVLCTEESPEECHRSRIASELEAEGIDVLHIVGGGLRRHQPSFDI